MDYKYSDKMINFSRIEELNFGICLSQFLFNIFQIQVIFTNYNLAIKLMGSCIVKGQNTKAEQLPSKAQKYLERNQKLFNRNSILSTATNPEELLKKNSDDISKKRLEIPTASSQNKTSQIPDSFISLSQLLASQNQGENNEVQEMNYQSSIIRLPKREKRAIKGQQSINKQKMRSVITSEFQKQQNLDSLTLGLDEFSRLLIRLQRIDFEFILPQLRAGPLVVPLINYNNYEV